MALILASVSDKTGLTEFAKKLSEKGFDFIASGGTAKVLLDFGIKVKEVSEYTDSPEILGGRVKTLHPVIHGGILARPNKIDEKELQKLNIEKIYIVIANLYPFEKTISNPKSSEQDCIENIDIGGVALLRAAAKNYERVTIICDCSDYKTVIEEIETAGSVSLRTRKKLAVKAFEMCMNYDSAISKWFKKDETKDDLSEIAKPECRDIEPSAQINIHGYESQALRYGENPHQKAWLYTSEKNGGVLGGKVLQGKELSYNNILDADAAWRTVSLFKNPAAVVVKHLTPCGIAELGSDGKDLGQALSAAISCDPVSAYGSIIAVNRPFDKSCLDSIGSLFVECIAAPQFTEEVRPILAQKKNLRLIENPLNTASEKYEFKSVTGGFLKQEKDDGAESLIEYKNAAKRQASIIETELLKFAFKACLMVKSNAIVLAAPIDSNNEKKGYCTVGIGCGQPNRVDAARHAAERAGEKAKGAVLASDAFFPFPDTIEVAAKAGITAVIQPGGSIRDNLSIEECNKYDMAMLVTGIRHFKH